jgi:hypothetical protein
MWLTLAKVSPELLAAIRVQPGLVEPLFFDPEEDDPTAAPPDGFDPASDTFGYDYRTLTMLAEAQAEESGDPAPFEDQDTWLCKAAHGTGTELPYEFCYGIGFVLEPADVVRVAEGLASEGWGEGGPIGEILDEDEDLGRFYAAAAREGKAVIGGVS